MTCRLLTVSWLLLAVGWSCATRISSAAEASDADRDGLPDAVEEALGTDKDLAEELVALGTFPAKAEKHPELDVVRVDFGNVAEDRWLWAIRFAQPYSFDNSSLIVYVDSDNDPETGRKDMGCEVMLSHRRGQPGVTAFAPDGSYAAGPLPRVALVEGVLYVCHDAPIHQENGRSRFRFLVLSEIAEPHDSADGTGWAQAQGPPNSQRPKVVMLDDVTEDENFETTEGLDLIWQLQADPANVVLSSVGAELEGFAYYDAEYRWPAVRGRGGRITVRVPKAGKFYPAVVVYDTAGPETCELRVDGRPVGRFLAGEGDNRQRVHFLSHPLELAAGTELTFRAGHQGNHITEDVLLLADKPPIRKRRFEIRQLEAGYVMRGGEPQARLTWITTWPSACTIEYGGSADLGQKVTEEEALANHRLYLSGLEPGQEVHWRVVAPRPDGREVVSPVAVFRLQPPPAPEGTAKRERIPLSVANPYDFALADFPVCSGVPFAEGELGSADHVRLLDGRSREIPVQPKAAVRWKDGSIKWLLLSMLATAEAETTATYTLEYGTEVNRTSAATPLEHQRQGKRLTVDTGLLRVQFDAARSGFPTQVRVDANGDGAFGDEEDLTGSGMIAAEVAGREDTRFTTSTPPDRVEIEESGPLRTVVKVTGHHKSPKGEPMFAYVNRFTFYAGLPWMHLRYTWGNDSEETKFTSFDRISLHVPLPAAPDWDWTVGLGGGKEAAGQGALTLHQLRDDSCEISPQPPGEVAADRADGWIDAGNGRWGFTTVVRDFWQLYPKGLRVTPDGLAVDLCPDFAEGEYDECSKLDQIKLYYYLMGGKYTVRLGVEKQHELLFSFHRGNLAPAARQTARAFQEPLIAACTPDRYCDTRVFGEILPATTGRWPEYEKVCEQVYQSYLRHRDRGHEFGMLNFGDQWGERKVNWANGEYDHHHAFLLQFIRTGDRKWYFLGEKAARHAIDVDTAHYGPQRGGEWIHSMGHTGDYFKTQHEGSGIPWGGMSVSHTWTEGFYDWYVLSGDPTAAENAALVADHYDGAYLNNYDWTNCRTNGWHLLLTMAAHRATNDPFYLNAARIIIDRTIERQAPDGGWPRQMVPGHCHDMPRHRGVANFMLGVLANGLEEYYREVPDPRVAEAVIGGAKQAVRELWVPEVDGFRYTSCPNMTGYTANNDMTSEILFFAHRLGGGEPFGEIAMRAMRSQFAAGIGSIAHLRWTPHIVHNMDRLQREGSGEPK